MTAVLSSSTRIGRAAGGGWRPHWPPAGARYTSGKRRGRERRAVRVDAAVGVVDDEANLRFSPADGAYGSVPAWRSRSHYLAALPWHPRLEAVCKRYGVRVELFLTGMALYAARADVETGRNIAVANSVVAELLGCSTRHVRNITRAAGELGLLRVTLAGAFMTMTQRDQVLTAYRRGHHSRAWRNLPNYCAAAVPAELVEALHKPLRELRRRLQAAEDTARAAIAHWHAAGLFRTGPRADPYGRRGPGQRRILRPGLRRPVDNSPLRDGVHLTLFRLPVGVTNPAIRHLHPYEKPLFQTGCGQTPREIAARLDQQQRRTGATRPTETHRRAKAGSERRFDPALKAYATAFRSALPASWLHPDPWRRVPLRRLAQGLNRHRLAGLTVAELVAGIGTYLRTTDRGWLLDWEPGQETEQAAYLGALLRDAAAAGELVPLPYDT